MGVKYIVFYILIGAGVLLSFLSIDATWGWIVETWAYYVCICAGFYMLDGMINSLPDKEPKQ